MIRDDYIKWVNSAMFAGDDNLLCWLDIDIEMEKLMGNYKVHVVRNVQRELRAFIELIVKSVASSQCLSDESTEHLIKSLYLQNDLITHVHECFENISVSASITVDMLRKRYMNEYLSELKSESLFKKSQITSYKYNYNLRSAGYRALYFFDDNSWYKYNKRDFFDIFQRCILNDFGTHKEVRNIIVDLRENIKSRIDTIESELRSSIMDLLTSKESGTIETDNGMSYSEVLEQGA